ncbi:hypothetical protein Scep_020342 [Stephania cephalantha]|uniref:Uncharacterized protein n=1 Tax=Stephania cephalantha TaxID=152367 RepID=A0AAP0NN37_9MAGN
MESTFVEQLKRGVLAVVLFEEIQKWGFRFGGFWWWCSEFELLSAGAIETGVLVVYVGARVVYRRRRRSRHCLLLCPSPSYALSLFVIPHQTTTVIRPEILNSGRLFANLLAYTQQMLAEPKLDITYPSMTVNNPDNRNLIVILDDYSSSVRVPPRQPNWKQRS